MAKTSLRMIFGSLAAWLLICGAALAQSDPQSAVARLGDGHIETGTLPEAGSDILWGRAQAIVNAPLEQVMRVVQDYGRYSEFLPHFTVSRVLSQKGANATVYMEALVIKKTLKVWVQASFRERPRQGNTRIIEGKMMQGNINRLNARWEITPLADGRTLVAFQMLFDPKLPLPDSMISNENSKAASRTIKALREKRLSAK